LPKAFCIKLVAFSEFCHDCLLKVPVLEEPHIFNHLTGAGIKAEPKILSYIVIPEVEPNRLDNPLLRAIAPDINCPAPGTKFTPSETKSYAVSNPWVIPPYFPPYSYEGPVAAPMADPTIVPANPPKFILSAKLKAFSPFKLFTF